MSDNDTPLERAVELLVYAPIGLAMFAKDTVPTFMKMFVARGQTEVTQRRKTAGSQAGQYRTIGEMAVKFGGPEVKRQAGAAAETVRKRAEETLTAVAAVAATPPAASPSASPTSAASSRPGSSPAPPAANGATPAAGPAPTGPPANSSGELAIAGYDTLSAFQIIERLDGLPAADLAALAEYEAAHRSRATILNKIAQLTS